MSSTTQIHDHKIGRYIRFSLSALLVVIVLALLPITSDPANDIKRFIFQFTGCVLCIIWFVASPRSGAPTKSGGLFAPLVFIWLLVQTIAAAFSDFPLNSAAEISKIVSLVAIYFVTKQVIDTPAHGRRLMAAVCVAVSLSSVYGVMQATGLDPIVWDEASKKIARYDELPGTFGNPNYAAHTLVLTILMAGYLMMHRGTRWCGILVPVFCANLYFTHSRTAWGALGAAVALVVFAKLFSQSGPLVRKAAMGVSAIALCALVFIAVSRPAATLKMVEGSMPVDASLLIRYNANYSAAKMISDRPWLGYGPGNYAIENPPYWTSFEQQHFGLRHLLNQHVHSDVLETWIETGVFGAFIYVAFMLHGIAGGLYAGFRCDSAESRKLGFALAMMFCAFAVDGVFGFNLRVPVSATLLFVMFGMLDGVFYADANRRTGGIAGRSRLPLRAAFIVILAVNAVYATNLYASKVLFRVGGSASHFGVDASAKSLLTTTAMMANHDPSSYFLMGEIELRQDNPGEASRFFRSALKRNPNNILYILAAADAELALAKRGDSPDRAQAVERAHEFALKAQQLCPFFSRAYMVLARVQIERINLDSQDPLAATSVQTDADLLQDARKHFYAALYWGAEDASGIYAALAELDMAEGKSAEAHRNLRKAVSLEQVSPVAWRLYHDFALQQDLLEPLTEDLRRGLGRHRRSLESTDEEEARIRHWLGRALAYTDAQSEEALKELAAAVLLDPSSRPYWAAYAAQARTKGQSTELYNVMRQVEATVGQDQTTWPVEVRALATLHGQDAQSIQRALDILVQSITDFSGMNDRGKIDPETRWVAELIAPLAVQLDDREAGIAIAKLGYVFEALNDLEEAHGLYELSLAKLGDNDAIPWVIRDAYVLSDLGEKEAAVSLLERGISKWKQRLDLELTLARVCAAVGLNARARLEYGIILQKYELDSEIQRQIEAELRAL